MLRGIAIGMGAGVCVGIAGLGGIQEPPPASDHPAVGHPSVPKPSVNWPKAKAEDVASIESIVAAYYASTSGKPKQSRDWERFQSLFLPDARLIPARPTADGGAGAILLPVTDYVEQNRKYFDGSGFIDRESAHRIEAYGNVAHVWSTYETRRQEADAEPYSRGIASIQLLKDNGRWWIVNVFWDYQRPENPIPEKYKATPKDKD